MTPERPPERTIPGPLIVLPVLVFAAAIVSISAYWLFSKGHSAPGPPPSMAVLPFAGDPLGDGIARQIIAEVSPIAGFETIAWQSSVAMRGQQDVRQIGQKLNVRNVVLGSVERSGTKVKVSARLMRADDGDQLWGKSYERDADEIFAVEDEISDALVGALGLRPVVPLEKAKPVGIEAYRLFLEGKYQEAIDRDSKYAPAYAALAESDRLAGLIPKARGEAEKALELDPRLVEGHVVLGYIRAGNDWDWNGARGEFERAMAINSADVHALRGMAMTVLAPTGRLKDAIGEMNRVVDLDPLDPIPAGELGLLLTVDRQPDAASAQFAKFGIGPPKAGEDDTAFLAACKYAKAGEKTRALDELDRAYDQHYWLLAYSKTWPDLDSLRSEPRFQALLKKMNLAR